MSKSSWKKQLASLLAPYRSRNDRSARVALLGIGNELNGDDAAGVILSRRLLKLLPRRDDILVLDGGLAPENFTGPLRRFRPDLIVLMDAGNFGGQTGEITLIDWREAEGFSGSTHTLPPAILAGYLQTELSCEIAILAIQAGQTGFDSPTSPAVEQAIQTMVEYLTAWITLS